jgi:quercetin dioxygenase-like cupin family protein
MDGNHRMGEGKTMPAHKGYLALMFLGGIAATAYAQTADQVVKLPHEVEFKAPLRPGGPPGAVIYGEPTKPGLYVNRVKFPPGFKVMPHWHAEERTVIVLSGTFYMGLGEQWDESKMKAYPPGTFLSEPPKTPHFTWAKDGEVIIQITGIGPTATMPIPPNQ